MNAAEAISALLNRRAAHQTICPSEAARLLAGPGQEWRAQMPQVHVAADELTRRGDVRLTWRGRLTSGADGPYRIARA